MTEHILVQTTFEGREQAVGAARLIVGERLAACAQVVGPITSAYLWEGELREDEEWLCVAKSHMCRYDALERAIVSIHPYDNPEILATPIIAGSDDYLAWLDEAIA